MIRNISLMLVIIFTLFALSASALEIEAPQNQTYNDTLIELKLASNQSFDNMTYSVDNQQLILACINCSNFDATLNLSEGNHTIDAQGNIENETFSDNVMFTIQLNQPQNNATNDTQNNITTDFALLILNPQNLIYNTTQIEISVIANETLDSISLKKDANNYESVCFNCTSYNATINFTEGNHTLSSKGILNEIEKEVSVNFSVILTGVNNTNVTPTNNTNETQSNTTNQTKGNRTFDKGFNKLPKLVQQGNISDSELAQIIRSHKLNPGILNRLIKTGKLGNESIQAILDTQFTPPGIFRKLLQFFGFKQKTLPELMLDNYNLTNFIEQKILTRDDISIKYVEKIEDKLKKEIKLEIKAENHDNKKDKIKIKIEEEIEDNESSVKFEIEEDDKGKKTFNAGRQNGKSKKLEIEAEEEDEDDNRGKGREKSNKAKSNNGKGKNK